MSFTWTTPDAKLLVLALFRIAKLLLTRAFPSSANFPVCYITEYLPIFLGWWLAALLSMMALTISAILVAALPKLVF